MASDRSLIAHLFRRAGFGARPSELDYYTRAGYPKAVADLVSGRPLMGGPPTLDETIEPVNQPMQNLRGRVSPPGLGDIQTTWLNRMVTTSAPLVERMTLFLHDLWATAFRPLDNIDTPEMTAQNNLLRTNALGNWRSLCHAMIEDVALSCWLNNDQNHKDHANENLAREFMELFTLGLGNYTEQDVREAARTLTGYAIGYNLEPTGPRYRMVFDAASHDDGLKTILRQTGRFMPHDFVDIVLGQAAAPVFLAGKLIETFVAPIPAPSLVDRVAEQLVISGWELRPALTAIFLSNEFTSTDARASLVKSPAEFVAGSLRALGRTSSDDIMAGISWMNRAGQVLYDPPTVGGWPSNEGWVGAGAILARYNAAVDLADRHVAARPLLPTDVQERGSSPGEWGEIFGITELAPATQAALDGYVRDSTDTTTKTLDAAMITLVVSSPDFTLA